MSKLKTLQALSLIAALLAGTGSVHAAPEAPSARNSSPIIEASSETNLQIAWFNPPRPRPSPPACACVRG